MEESVEFHSPASLIPEKEPSAPIEQKASWVPEPVSEL